MALPDTRKIDEAVRVAAALRVKEAYDFTLPPLQYWNYSNCRAHRNGWVETYWDAESQTDKQRTVIDRPSPGCRKCGIHHRRHQRVGSAWLYLVKRGLLADSVGTGKTTHAATLLAMIKESGEMEDNGRVIICCRAPALLQWRDELARMIPSIVVAVAMGTRKQRIDYYLNHWEVVLISPQTLINDWEMLLNFPLSALIVDDVDALRNRENRTSYVLKRIAQQVDRFVFLSGTPLQKRLAELHSVLEPMGGREIFGSEAAFMRRYVRTEPITFYNHHTGRKTTTSKTIGYKNLDEFVRLIQPLALRRTAADIDDVDLPTIIPSDVELELWPDQRAKYDELKREVITIIKAEGSMVKQATGMAKVHFGTQICGGMATLGEADGPRRSIKLDWIMNQVVDGDLSEEKVVVFAIYKNSIRALAARLTAAGVGHELVWGEQPDKVARARSQERFWQDPQCRVLLGTASIEQSLNLQVSRHLINIDRILNPARMEQLAGRIRRDGSAFKTVYVHNLICVDTLEERVGPLLEREQALLNAVWGEQSELFHALNPLELLQLISG